MARYKKASYDKHPKQGQPFTPFSYTPEEEARLAAEFHEKQAFLAAALQEVTPYDYYRDMFPAGAFENEGDKDKPDADRRPNGVASVLVDSTQEGRRYNRIIFDDLAMIDELRDKEFVVVPPIGYSGRRRLAKCAYRFYGMIFDLDNVAVFNVRDLLFEMQNGILPYATYLVNSGTGLHVVYLFDEPIPAFPVYFKSMQALKKRLSEIIWNQYTSRDKDKQAQGIFQGYRLVGSCTKINKDCRVTAYRCGKKVSLHYLNEFVEKEHQCIFNDLKYTSLNEAKELYPDWYKRRIEEQRPVGDYTLTEGQRKRRRAWYEAWKKRIRQGAFDGNRYYCVGVLFHYAMKAEIPLEEAYDDALALIPYLNSLTEKEGNDFTEFDVMSAAKYYDRKYIKIGLAGIESMTKIKLSETPRNKRRRKEHLQAQYFKNEKGRPESNPCRQNRELALQYMRENGEIKGRPKGSGTAQSRVADYRAEHPEASVTEVARALGISRTTVYKWWGE